MAVVSTSFTLDAVRLPLIAPVGEPDIWWSNYPKAELVFVLFGAPVTLATGGDTQNLTITCPLPVSYAYTLADVTMLIHGANADDWYEAALLELVDKTPVPTWGLDMQFQSTAIGGLGNTPNTSRNYGLQVQPPGKTLLATSPGAGLTMVVTNDVIDGSALQVNFYARFLQFDLNQGFRTSINSPVLTR